MTNDDDRADRKTGFAGLSTMVSDVEAAVKLAADQAPSPSSKSPPAGSDGAAAAPAPQNPGKDYSAAAAGIVFLIGVVVVVTAIGLSAKNRDSDSPTYSAASFSPPVPYDPPSGPPTFTYPPATVPRADKSPTLDNSTVGGRPTEEKPPKGSGNILTIPQIRYCLAEDMRLGAADGVVDEYNSSAVDRFNVMVDDYNSRCAEFRYQSGALESARRDTGAFRTEIEAEGVARFSRRDAAPIRADRSSSDENNSLSASSHVPSAAERSNFATCISGDYATLCNHGMLTVEEAAEVKAAEHRSNFRICISGDYATLCNHEMLTPEEAVKVRAAEARNR